MKKILAIFTLLAGVASAQSFIRTHTIVSDNSTFPSPANVEWMSGESVRFEITAKSGNFYIPLSNGVAPVLKMWSGNVITQLYAQKTGTIYSAGSGKLYVDLLANEANITPTGAYNYAVGIYDGTQYMGVVAQGRASIRGHPFGASVGYVGSFNAFPYVPSNDAAYLNAITNIVAGTNITVSRSGRQVTVNSSASGGGSGTFTNLQWGTNNNTAQALISAESNIVFRSAGGSNYAALAGNLTGDFTFNGAINANDNIEIANTKHLRFQDGGGTNTVHLAATAGRLIITGALDIVSGQAVPATINGSQIAVNSDVSLRLASNVWAVADSTTNYAFRTTSATVGQWNAQVGGVSNWVVNATGNYVTANWAIHSLNGVYEVTNARGGQAAAFQVWWTNGSLDLVKMSSGSIDGPVFKIARAFGSDGQDHYGEMGIPPGNVSYVSTGELYRIEDTKLRATPGYWKIWDAGNLPSPHQGSIVTQGTGNVVTNIVSGGTVVTQQLGTVSAGSGAITSVATTVSGLGTTTNASVVTITGAVTAVSVSPWVDTWEVANTISTQIIAGSSFSNINFDTYAPENTGRSYNITNDVLTFSSTGLCHVTAAARVFGMSSTARAQMALYKNGSLYRQGIVISAATNATPTLSVSFYNTAATNQYNVWVQHEDATARTLTGAGASSGYFIWASGYRFRNAGE